MPKYIAILTNDHCSVENKTKAHQLWRRRLEIYHRSEINDLDAFIDRIESEFKDLFKTHKCKSLEKGYWKQHHKELGYRGNRLDPYTETILHYGSCGKLELKEVRVLPESVILFTPK